MKFLKISLLLLLTTVLDIICLEVEECVIKSQKIPIPLEVIVENCEKLPCEFKRGTKAIMYMKFKAVEFSKSITAKVVATVNGLSVPYPLPRPNVCDSLTDTHCPLEENETAIYRLEMPIAKLYPKVFLELQLSLEHNGKSEKFACFNMQADVV